MKKNDIYLLQVKITGLKEKIIFLQTSHAEYNENIKIQSIDNSKLKQKIDDFKPSGLIQWIKYLIYGVGSFDDIIEIKQKIKKNELNADEYKSKIASDLTLIKELEKEIFQCNQDILQNKWRIDFEDDCELHHESTVDGNALEIINLDKVWHKDYLNNMLSLQEKKFPQAHSFTKKTDTRVMYCKKCREEAIRIEKEFIIKLYQEYELKLKVVHMNEAVLQKNYIQKHIALNFKTDLENIYQKYVAYKIAPYLTLNMLLEDVRKILSDIDAWHKRSNDNFIKNEVIQYKDFFETVESQPLTKMQQIAVITNELNNLILAGAGSGKTSVIIAKVGYILKKNLVKPEDILILAFNKKAQEELLDRMKTKLGVVVDIKTFHSLGLGIITQVRNEKPSLCKWVEQPSVHNIFKEIITELINSSIEFFNVLSEYFISFFAPYKSMEDFTTLGEYYNYIRNYDIKTFKGETVRSFEECEIANQLFIWGIEYKYEEPYRINTATITHRQYIPDFYLPEYDIYIEHFGINKEGKTAPTIDTKKYIEDMVWKIETHKNNNTKLIQTFSYEKSDGELLSNLKTKLESHQIFFNCISPQEALELFNKSFYTDRLTKLLATFIGHFKSRQISIQELKSQHLNIRETKFLNLFELIFNRYMSIQQENGCIDFDDMIVEAVSYVEAQRYFSNYKYILVDEFQDISLARANLVNEIRKHREDSVVSVVGDDWQSINRFAGGDITIIQDFESIFGTSEMINLDMTFRFNETVSQIATNFITKNPKQIEKQIKAFKKEESQSIYINWYSGKDEMLESLQYLINLIGRRVDNSSKKTIKILVRNKYVLDMEKYNKIIKPDKNIIDISIETIHKSKGLEADYVIIVGLDSSKLGFPSRIENDPLLNIVMSQADNFEDAEERRLFYVALTRTKDKIFLLASKNQISCFVDELLTDNKDKIFEIGASSDEFEECELCKTGILIKRRDRNQHWFYGCSNFPLCDYTQSIKMCPTCGNFEVKKDKEQHKAFCKDANCAGYVYLCTECGNYMIKRKGQYGVFLGCESYPKCTNTINLELVR